MAALVAVQVTTPEQERASSSKQVIPSEESSAVAEVLENTLWNRQLGAMSEEIVAALVCQIFEGWLPLLSCSHLLQPALTLRGSYAVFILIY